MLKEVKITHKFDFTKEVCKSLLALLLLNKSLDPVGLRSSWSSIEKDEYKSKVKQSREREMLEQKLGTVIYNPYIDNVVVFVCYIALVLFYSTEIQCGTFYLVF